jgi:sugar lactone lactonase YvrE
MKWLALVALTISCSSCSSSPPPMDDGGTDAATVPTNTTIDLDGDANGLYWDAATSTLFIADDGNNRILTYTDAAGVTKLVDLPPASASGPGLGQLIPLDDGSLLVTRFGYGTAGDVVQVMPDTTTKIITGLDPTRRRIGLARADDGSIFDTYFVKNGTAYVGSVAKLSLAGTETDVVTSLQKPVGVLVTGGTLFFDDQSTNTLYSTPAASPGASTQFALLPDADLLCVGPNGTMFSGGADGNVRQIDASGAVTVFATGFAGARGVAYDAANHRLFIANHVGASGPNTVEVRPVP